MISVFSSFLPVWKTFVLHGFSFDGRILENHQKEQKESYETQLEGLKLKVDHLQNENNKLQNLFQEKSNVNESIRQEVSRLSSENSVRFVFLLPYFTVWERLGAEHAVIHVCFIQCDLQVIPELKLQVSELQRQKQELEAHVEEQRTELAGRSVLFCFFSSVSL